MKYLAAIDGSAIAFNAMKTACAMASETGASVVALFVNKGEAYTTDQTSWLSIREKIADELEHMGEDTIQKAFQIGKDHGVPIEGVMAYGLPAHEIVQYAEARGIISLIAMGHSSKGLAAQEFAESISRTVVASARPPVLVVSDFRNIRTIAALLDDGETVATVSSYAGRLAKSLQATLVPVAIVPDVERVGEEYRLIAEVPNIEKHIRASRQQYEAVAVKRLAEFNALVADLGGVKVAAERAVLPDSELPALAGRYDLVIEGCSRREGHRKFNRNARWLLRCYDTCTLFV